MTTRILQLLGDRAIAKAGLDRLATAARDDPTLFPAWSALNNHLTSIETEIASLTPETLGGVLAKIEVLRANGLESLARKVARDHRLTRSLSRARKFLRRSAAAVALMLATISTAHAQTAADAIDIVVMACVEYVHRINPTNPYEKYYHQTFDAYYDRVSGLVEYNATSQNALFAFRKCMSVAGIPMTPHRP